MIPFEIFSQSNSYAYFKYEEQLHLYDPVISNMVSKRYRCAIYSDLEDEEDETDFTYESEEEELSDVKKMEPGSVSVNGENSNSDFLFGNFLQDSDLQTVCVTPTISFKPEIEGRIVKIGKVNCPLKPLFLDPEVKEEEKSGKISTDESKFFNLKSKFDFLFFKNLLHSSPDSVSEFLASDLFRHLRMEFGNLSPTAMSSPVADVFATPSKFSSFSFDPGGASKIAGYTAIRSSDFVFNPPHDTLILLSTDLIQKCADLTFAKPTLVFDPGGSLAVDFVVAQHLLHDANHAMNKEDELFFADLISQKLMEDPILVFDPGGSCAVDNSAVCGVRVLCFQ